MADERRPHPVTGQPFPSPVPPGTGWPGDPATRRTPVATDEAEVRRLAGSARTLARLDGRISVCRACPRLVEWREDVARTGRRASFADQPYWGRPLPGFGDAEPRLLVVGLAPAANGGNRTGRTFTGDRSGDWIYAALHRAGFAAVPWSRHAGDGQELHGARIVAAVRCAPPANRPTPAEVATCGHWLDRELELSAPSVRVLLALGAIAWDATLAAVRRAGGAHERPKPRFGHAARTRLAVPEAWQRSGAAPTWTLLASYHVSQQNTFTGRLTEPMLDEVLLEARALAGWTA